MLTKTIRWRMILRGGFLHDQPISIFEHKEPVRLTLLEHLVYRAIYFAVFALTLLAVWWLRFS